MKKNGHWEYPVEIDPSEWFGFIYRIIETDTGKQYIGKKQFWNTKRKIIKNRKNRKKVIFESNWKEYTGSSKLLNESIEKNGIEKYAFMIESLHKSKGSLFYAEVEKQIKENVLREKLNDGSPKYFNRQIAGVKFVPPDVLAEEAYANIDNYIINEFQLEKITGLSGEKNPMWGKSPITKGVTWEEFYGKEKADQLKENLRYKCRHYGVANGMFGKNHSEETKNKWKSDERRKHFKEKNGFYKKKHTEETKKLLAENASKQWKGIPKSEEHKKKIRNSNIGRKQPVLECPHCSKIGGATNMKRYHFDNCKFLKNKK